MKITHAAIVAVVTSASSPAFAIGGVSCWPQGAGVGGMITDQSDVVDAINCLGKQLAAVRNDTAFSAQTHDNAQRGRVEDIALQIAGIQGTLAALLQRVSDIERRQAAEAKK